MMLTQKRLKEILSYDAKTGGFIWVNPTSKGMKAGDVAGCQMRGDGSYIVISIDNTSYCAHVLAWLYMTGKWPDDQLDHKNRIRGDNRFTNLREATSGENKQNASMRSDNKSGFIGVSWSKKKCKWEAKIRYRGKLHFLGYFDEKEKAYSAYLVAKNKLHSFNPWEIAGDRT